MPAEIISTDASTSSIPDGIRRQPAEIIYLDDYSYGSVANPTTLDSSVFPQRRSHLRKIDLRDSSSFEVRKKVDSELLFQAYISIVDALDDEIDNIERSNHFDEWKDHLQIIISKVSNLGINNRKILGGIIVATKGKDLADFSREHLILLREATFMLRQFGITRNEGKKIIEKLINIGSDMVIPLSVDCISSQEEENLDQLIKSLIEISK